MADRIPGIGVEDLTSVRSRVSWGAVAAGSVTAVAVYFVLALFFAAVGISLTNTSLTGETIGWTTVVAGLISAIASLFIGGYVTAQLIAGETRQEAIVHGLLTWATVTALTMAMVSAGLRAGVYTAAGGLDAVRDNANASGRSWEQMARDAGVSQERIDQAKQGLNPDNLKAQANDPANRERVRGNATGAAWATFGSVAVSILACMGGALVGCGPRFRLFPVATGTVSGVVHERQTTVASR
jgi:Kef-type K+ transport system membrane component KefB